MKGAALSFSSTLNRESDERKKIATDDDDGTKFSTCSALFLAYALVHDTFESALVGDVDVELSRRTLV